MAGGWWLVDGRLVGFGWAVIGRWMACGWPMDSRWVGRGLGGQCVSGEWPVGERWKAGGRWMDIGWPGDGRWMAMGGQLVAISILVTQYLRPTVSDLLNISHSHNISFTQYLNLSHSISESSSTLLT